MIYSFLSLFSDVSANFGKSCTPGGSNFLDFPTWYSYLKDGIYDAHGVCLPRFQGLSDTWLVVMAIIEILLRVAAIMAVIFVVYAGISYTTSQGDPEATGRAKGTLVNALIGLAIAVMASAIVAFIAGSFN
jgi:hypothetical protein